MSLYERPLLYSVILPNYFANLHFKPLSHILDEISGLLTIGELFFNWYPSFNTWCVAQTIWAKVPFCFGRARASNWLLTWNLWRVRLRWWRRRRRKQLWRLWMGSTWNSASRRRRVWRIRLMTLTRMTRPSWMSRVSGRHSALVLVSKSVVCFAWPPRWFL